MIYLKYIGLIFVSLAIGFSVGKFTQPAKQETKQTENLEESKTTDTVRVIDKKETLLPDGTKITETTSSTKRTTDSNTKKESSSDTKIETRPDYRANLIYFPDVPGFQEQNVVLDLQKRILSEIYLGISVSTQKQLGLSISVGF